MTLWLLIAILSVALIVSSSQSSKPDWSKPSGDLQNTGQSPFVGPATNRVRWTLNLNSGQGCNWIAVGINGTVFCVGNRPNDAEYNKVVLWAVAENGQVKWTNLVEYPNGCPNSFAHFAPCVSSDGSVLYVGSGCNSLVAYSTHDGTILWSRDLANYGLAKNPVVSKTGNIYISTEMYGIVNSKNITVLSSSGSIIQHATFRNLVVDVSSSISEFSSSIAFSMDERVIYLPCGRTLYALANTTLDILWSSNVTGAIQGAPVVGPDGTVFVGTYHRTYDKDGGYNVYAVEGLTGVTKWKTSASSFQVVGTLSLSSNGVLYVPTMTGLYAYRSTDGTSLWSNSVACFPPVIIGNDGTLYCNNIYASLYAMSPTTGGTKWVYSPTNQAQQYSAPSLSSNGTLLVAMDISTNADVILTAIQDIQCGTGTTVSSADSSRCVPCAAGTYALSGSAMCSTCAAGTYSASEGSASCAPCAAGTYSPFGRAGCVVCPTGQQSGAGASACTAVAPVAPPTPVAPSKGQGNPKMRGGRVTKVWKHATGVAHPRGTVDVQVDVAVAVGVH
jgi:hypothetical protein